MFLSELKAEPDKESETAIVLLYPNTGDIHVSAISANERNNWLKKISLAQKHIIDTERSILQRKQSSKLMLYLYFMLI